MAEYHYVTGQKVYNWILRRKIASPRNASVNTRNRWQAECICGTIRNIPEYYFRRVNPLQHCGCLRKTIKTHFNEEYRIWLMMHKRTEDPKHVSYKRYGGRGIKVCEEWNRSNPDGKGFERFVEYIGKRPSKRHTIDRVNNNLGYQPYQEDGVTRQVRWATAKEQRANQG